MPITLWGNPVLESRCALLTDTDFDAGLRELAERMLRVMHAAAGAGIAAPQVGDARSFFVYDCDGRQGFVANPQVVERSRDLQDDEEGCLSVPGFAWPTVRAQEVVVTGRDLDGAPLRLHASGYLARCFQHEVDHLDGRLYLSRLGGRTGRRAAAAARSAQWFGRPSRFVPLPV